MMKSRMIGEYQAGFCKRLRVRVPLPTRRLGRQTAQKLKWKH